MYCILVKTIPPSHDFCVHPMHFFPLSRQSQGRLCPVLQYLAFQSHTTQPLHAERGVWPRSCLFLPPCGLAAAQAGPKPFLIWWWAVKWPACPHDWVAAARVGFQGFPYRGGLFGLGEWYCTHTLTSSHTHTHTHTSRPSHPPQVRLGSIFWATLALFRTPSVPLGKLRCQE